MTTMRECRRLCRCRRRRLVLSPRVVASCRLFVGRATTRLFVGRAVVVMPPLRRLAVSSSLSTASRRVVSPCTSLCWSFCRLQLSRHCRLLRLPLHVSLCRSCCRRELVVVKPRHRRLASPISSSPSLVFTSLSRRHRPPPHCFWLVVVFVIVPPPPTSPGAARVKLQPTRQRPPLPPTAL